MGSERHVDLVDRCIGAPAGCPRAAVAAVPAHDWFGLIRQRNDLSAYAWKSSESPPVALNLLRTGYKIDSYQQTYFVIDSFQQLFDMTAPDFTPLYAQRKTPPELAANALLPEDAVIQR